MIQSEVFPRVHLSEIVRTKSLELLNNIRYFHSPMPFEQGDSFGMRAVPCKSKAERGELVTRHVVSILDEKLPDWRKRPFDFFVTTYRNETIHEMLEPLRTAFLGFKPPRAYETSKSRQHSFCAGDRVMCVKNTWTPQRKGGVRKPGDVLIANGMLGIVTQVFWDVFRSRFFECDVFALASGEKPGRVHLYSVAAL